MPRDQVGAGDRGRLGYRRTSSLRELPPATRGPHPIDEPQPQSPAPSPQPLFKVRVAVVGSGFAGSLLARVLAVQGHDVVLLERGTHPRFAIGESSTPLANLSLERLAFRYGLEDCYQLATHGRWLAHFPELHRGLKRGFTYYRHHPHQPFENRGLDSERLLVAACPQDSLS